MTGTEAMGGNGRVTGGRSLVLESLLLGERPPSRIFLLDFMCARSHRTCLSLYIVLGLFVTVVVDVTITNLVPENP